MGADKKYMEKFEETIDTLCNKTIGSDPHGFIDFITEKELRNYIETLKPKGIKKKPMYLSFDRLNMMIMTIFKFFESEILTTKNAD